MRKKHTILYWTNRMFLLLLGVCSLILVIFAKMSMENLMQQEIENRKAILKLNVDNINGNLSALQSYLYQTFGGTDAEDIIALETGTDETRTFMATQSLTRSLQKIVGWNTSLKFLFFYSPDSPDKTFLRVSSQGADYAEKENLGSQVTDYIDSQLEAKNYIGKGYLLTKYGENGYVIRFYKVRNSYFGMCIDSRVVLSPLEEATRSGDCMAFLCDVDGRVISQTEGFHEKIDIEDNGSLLKRNGETYLQLNYLSKEEDFYIGTWTKATAIIRQIQWMRNLIFVFVFVFLFGVVLMSVMIRKALCQPIHTMEQSMKKVGDGDWDIVVKEESRILEYNNMIQNFNEMVSEIKDLKIYGIGELDAILPRICIIGKARELLFLQIWKMKLHLFGRLQ